MEELLPKKSVYGEQGIKLKLVLSAFEPWCARANRFSSSEAGGWTLGRAISDQVDNQLR